MRVRVVGAAIVRDGRCLVAQRSARMSAPHAWEFPGGKIEPGESPEHALARELAEELGVVVEVGALIGVGVGSAGERSIELSVYWARLSRGEPRAREHQAVRWLQAEQLADLAWAEADRPIVPLVAAGLSRLCGGAHRAE